MGLAEPRKRIKLSHDPNNTAWTSSNSFGQRLMQEKHGWIPGTALGANSQLKASDADAAKVRIAVKDNTLGLGASLKSQNVEHQRTGLDAFQGLLGRLNAKDEKELRAVEAKVENKKLAMFAQGRWGGMVFVPGGLLVKEDPIIQTSEKELQDQDEDSENSEAEVETAVKRRKKEHETPEERAQRKAEKLARKEARAKRREERRLKKLGNVQASESGTNMPISVELSSAVSTPLSTPARSGTSTPIQARSGRAILRGKNILAKRAAFSDAAGLDQIFMRQVTKV